MSSVATTIPEVNDIVDTNEEREFWTVVKEHERPPFFHTNEGVGNRLARAARVVTDGRITPNSDGSFTIEGSEGRTYRCAESCSCPNSQKAKSKWCYHLVATALYVEWQRRLRPAPAPVVLGTLRAGTAELPLPPVTVDERLAQPPTLADRQALYTQASLPLTPDDNDPQYLTPHTPQEDRMPDDDPYIPEPDDLPPVAVEDPPAPVPLRIPREYTVQIKGRTHVLYTGLVVTARTQGLMSLSADWTYNDAELSLAHAVCTFADGRRYEESGDATPSNVSKGIAAHFRRVALTRAKARCLRDALGISECSVEELEEDTGKRETPDMTQGAPEDLKKQIWTRIKQQAPDLQREEVGRWVWDHTGLALNPTNYPQILAQLERR